MRYREGTRPHEGSWRKRTKKKNNNKGEGRGKERESVDCGRTSCSGPPRGGRRMGDGKKKKKSPKPWGKNTITWAGCSEI